MARGKRNLTTAEKIEQVEETIRVKEEELKNLKTERKDLLDQKKKEEMEELYQIIVESGKSMDEVRKLLSGEV